MCADVSVDQLAKAKKNYIKVSQATFLKNR